MHRSGINTKALFSDQTEEFLQVQTIGNSKKKGKKQFILRIRLRAARGETDECRLMTDDDEIPMQIIKEDDWFTYYEAETSSRGEPVRYAFRIIAGDQEFVYTRTGIRKRNGIRRGWWYYAPDFEIPKWAKGAVMYQIFTDRFCNGDPSNNVEEGEYIYNGAKVVHIGDW